jgi:MazG family protein
MADSPGTLFESLLTIMSRLRGEGGCPWDREQTRQSLKPYVIEEAYEVVEAIDSGSAPHLREELGDLLFQVVFHCQLAAEQGEFTMADLLARLCDKMIRRHPHVFADKPVADAREALAQWERIKRDEGNADGSPRSALDGVPQSLPALLRAQRLQVKAGRVGFDWSRWEPAWAKVREEMAELDERVAEGDATRIREELGDVLFSIVNVARLLDLDAEDTLRQAAEKFTRRFREVEAEMRAEGRAVSDASLDDLDKRWERVKAREAGIAVDGGAPPGDRSGNRP